MSAAAIRVHVRQYVQGVDPARVFHRVVLEVRDAVIQRNVLHDGSGLVDRVPDDRLALTREADELRVTAALQVADTVAVPAVLVVPQEPALRIRRQGRLPGPAETEDHTHIPARTRV